MPELPQWQKDRYATLLDACGGLALSDTERRALMWLAGWEPHIVEAIADLIRRSRSAADGT
ncbi:hypothetical protein [Amycolatopsis sp. GM8]|uniref:hypothetical protein n=1 Tax=Amycolatopsis sp. GM8 TaxID=2896530 RepID=UPI001F347514|nr:hypothetical protein [Amycolatopsis sp. GM8]